MDSVTQIALGAAVGEATAGRQVGRRALIWGAVCGTLPDLDSLIPLGDPVRDFTYHRSVSHSLLVLTLLTPLVARLIMRLHPGTRQHSARWHWLVLLVFSTHVLLDCLTIYGTQIWWPLPLPPVTWSTIFIIDPVYTLPLLLGVLCALFMARHQRRGYRLNLAGLVLSSAYLAWSIGAKLHVDSQVRSALAEQGVGYDRLITNPGPFNTLLWRVVAVDENGYHEGFYSLLAPRQDLHLRHFPSDRGLLGGLEDDWAVKRLQWFTKGFYGVVAADGDILIKDLRMGFEPDYYFVFKVGKVSNPHPLPVPVERLAAERDLTRLPEIWALLWDAQ